MRDEHYPRAMATLARRLPQKESRKALFAYNRESNVGEHNYTEERDIQQGTTHSIHS
jgi:hypothetical protein